MFFYDNFRRNQLRFVRKSKVKCERDFLQFHRCKHAVMHLLNCISRMQSEIEQRHLWFQGKSEKRVLILYRVFRKLSFGTLPGFSWREAIRIPAFFIFKKGAGSQLLIFSRSPVTKIRVNILPGKFNITSANIANKKKCSLLPELFRPRSKVNITSGGTGQIWTGEWRFCRPLPYHLATVPYEIRNAARSLSFSGAGDEARTRYLHLGKVDRKSVV